MAASMSVESKDKKHKKKGKSRSKEPSPAPPNAETVASEADTAALPTVTSERPPSGVFASLPKLTGLSAGQPPDSPQKTPGEFESDESKSEPAIGPIISKEEFSLNTRPFLTTVFEALDCSENDYLVLFSLCLLRAIQKNEGMSQALLESVRIPCNNSSSKEWYNVNLVEKLLQILFSVCKHGSKIRLVTLDASINLLGEMVMDSKSYLSDTHFAQLEGIKEESTLLLRNFYKSEEIFLDMFEDEYHSASKSAPRLELILSDASLLLPPTVTPLTGIYNNEK